MDGYGLWIAKLSDSAMTEAMDGAMRPPPVPQKAKRAQVAPPADEPAPKRIELLGLT